MAKKRKKLDPTTRNADGRRSRAKADEKTAPANSLRIRRAGPNHLVANFGPVVMEVVEPPIPVPRKRPRKN